MLFIRTIFFGSKFILIIVLSVCLFFANLAYILKNFFQSVWVFDKDLPKSELVYWVTMDAICLGVYGLTGALVHWIFSLQLWKVSMKIYEVAGSERHSKNAKRYY